MTFRVTLLTNRETSYGESSRALKVMEVLYVSFLSKFCTHHPIA